MTALRRGEAKYSLGQATIGAAKGDEYPDPWADCACSAGMPNLTPAAGADKAFNQRITRCGARMHFAARGLGEDASWTTVVDEHNSLHDLW